MRIFLIPIAVAFGFGPFGICLAQPASPETRQDRDPGGLFLEANSRAPGVVTLPSGLQYQIYSSGPAGGASPRPKDEVKVHYEGKLLDGLVFDSSYQRGIPADYLLDSLIPAWIEAIQLMKPGDRWIVWAPPELGYGDRTTGPIPGGSVLEFKIELISFERAGFVQGDRLR